MTILSGDRARLDLDRIHGWLAASYWSPGIARDVVWRAIAGSEIVGAYDAAGRQIGFARAITDRATFAWLADVVVDESVRGQGIGRAMVAHLRARSDLAGLRRWMLVTRDAHGVYEALGFGPVDRPDRLMQIYAGEAIA